MSGPRGTTVNVNSGGGPDNSWKYGTIPQGFMLQESPEGPRMVSIPGGPVSMEEAAAAEKEALREDQQERTSNIVVEDIGRIQEIMDGSAIPVTGGVGALTSQIPGTGAFDVSRLLDGIKANIGFDKLNQMRAASPTGGALGSVTERELALLQSVMGSVEQSQSEEQFARNLKRLNGLFQETIHGAPQQPPADASIDDLLSKYGN